MKTRVEFLRKLPSPSRLNESLENKPEKFLIIYDGRLESSKTFKEWVGSYRFTYKVRGGEALKDLNDLAYHVKRIFKLVSPFSARSLCVVAIGGGSVGDFAGFISSILKRGVPLIQIPTTLLAAMDSAHGGKTALNVGDLKNQVGTFYPADSVLIAKEFFENLPPVQIHSAFGELAKMALIEGGELLEELRLSENPDLEVIWKILPKVIEAKNKWVEKDPLERVGERQVLNFGHSLGHVLEGVLGIPHGVAVGEGLIFASQWSHHQGHLKSDELKNILDLLINKLKFLPAEEFCKIHKRLSASKMHKFISEDKKLVDTSHLTFVFLDKIGMPFRKKMTLQSFITETQRQGWTRL